MLKVCDGIYDYIPLECVAFHFVETDEREYRVEISYGGHTRTLFEKRYFGTPTMHTCMKRVASIPDGIITTLGDLFEE